MTAEHPLDYVLRSAGILAPENDRPHPTVDLTGLPTASAGDPAAARYASKALDYECSALALTPEGGRNDALNRAAYKLGSLVSAGHLDRDELLSRLWQAARSSGLGDREIRSVIRRAARDGAATPRTVHLRDTSANLTVIAGQGTSTPDGEPRPAESAGGPLGTVGTGGNTSGEPPSWVLPTVDLDEVLTGPPPEPAWLAYPLFEEGALYAVYSPAKHGKSLFLLDICAALAAGRPVLGQPAGAPVDVLYVDFENTRRDLHQRLTDLGYRPGELKRLHYVSFPTLPALDTVHGGALLTANAQHYGARVVVLDTIGRTIQGEENTADTWHALYRATMVPLKAAGVCVIRLDHMGKDVERGMRGSSAKVSDVDTAFALHRLDGPPVRIRVERTATRNGNSPEVCVFDQHGDPLRHVPSTMDEQTGDVARLLRLFAEQGIPHHWGRRRILAQLTATGVKARTSTLAEAVRRWRQTAPGLRDPDTDTED